MRVGPCPAGFRVHTVTSGENMINGVTAKLGLNEQETSELCQDFAMRAAAWHKRLDLDSGACYLCTTEIEQAVLISTQRLNICSLE